MTQPSIHVPETLAGIRILRLERFHDERGFFMEIFRTDWKTFFGDDTVVQSNVSMTFPGIVRAWHRHARGQTDYLLVLRGRLKICAYDDEPDSPTRGQLFEYVATGEEPCLVRVPGKYWHGVKALGDAPAWLVYFVTRLYDFENPDEERRPWNDPTIIDPRTGRPYDWFAPPHR